MNTHFLSHIDVQLTPEGGASEPLMRVRVVPAGRDGKTVFGRTLGANEEDSGERIVFYPHAGESVLFPVGSIQIGLQDIDRASAAAADGYAPLSGTLWTWLKFGAPPDPALFRFLFVAARRLDTAHALCNDVLSAARERLPGALGRAEMMCGALGRGLDMIQTLPAKFAVDHAIPPAVARIAPALGEIRYAFEHIDDRAIGNVRGKLDADALSIFDQRRLTSDAVLTHASHSLDLKGEVVPVLVESRRFLFEVAIAAAGAARGLDVPLQFPSALAGAFERIQERAYYLWERREGSAWWDADANWREAELSVAAIARADARIALR